MISADPAQLIIRSVDGVSRGPYRSDDQLVARNADHPGYRTGRS
jgi:hypothetical protein